MPADVAAVDGLRRRAVSGFCLYDVASSAFVTTVVTAVGGPFVLAVARRGSVDGRADLLGIHLRPGTVFALATSLSVLLQIAFLPLLGAAADRSDAKRRLLGRGTAVGVVATLALSVVPLGSPLLAVAAFVVANVAFGVGVLAYNAYLHDVAEPADSDRVSARAFAAGYAGGGLLLAVDLLVVLLHARLGLSKTGAARVAIASAALWWGAFGALSVRRLRAVEELHPRHPHDPHHPDPSLDHPHDPHHPDPSLDQRNQQGLQRPLGTPAGSVDHGVGGEGGDGDNGDEGGEGGSALGRLKESVQALRALPGTARFLLSFLLFNDAIQAVVGLSAVFLTQELYVSRGLQESDATTFLLTLVLVIQVVAVPGSVLSARLAGRVGTKAVLVGELVVWVGVVLFAVTGLRSTTAAYGLGVVIALVLGGTQSLARSLFSRMVPAGRQASFFGFYELAERGTAWIGSLVFGVVLEVTGDYRGALLSLLVLFAAGGLLLVSTDTDAAVASVASADGGGQGVQLGEV